MRIEPGTRARVTGASWASGALSERLAARGAAVGLMARSASKLDGLVAALPGSGYVALPSDVGDPDPVAEAVARFAEDGPPALVAANAGITHYGPFRSQSLEEAEAMVRVNVMGVVHTVHATLPLLLDRGAGHIVIVSSGAGMRAFPPPRCAEAPRPSTAASARRSVTSSAVRAWG